MFRKNGFTLAEVLVTLLVIGVVAALTVPQLLQKTDDQQLRVKWKKTFSDIQQATNYLSANQWESIDFTSDTTFRDEYAKVLTYIKTGAASTILASPYYFYKSSSTISMAAAPYPTAVLKDGSSLSFGISIGSVTPVCEGVSGSLTNICGWMFIDINGKSGPNSYGRDFLGLWIRRENNNYEVYPMGITSPSDGLTCQTASAAWTTSMGCSAIALTDGSMP